MFKQSMMQLICTDSLLLQAVNWSTILDLETFIKGHYVYNDIWTPKQGEQLDVLIEPDNRIDKFAVCVKINKKSCEAFKESYIQKVCKDNLLFPAQWCVLKRLGKSYR